jgi:hypothetical protein
LTARSEKHSLSELCKNGELWTPQRCSFYENEVFIGEELLLQLGRLDGQVREALAQRALQVPVQYGQLWTTQKDKVFFKKMKFIVEELLLQLRGFDGQIREALTQRALQVWRVMDTSKMKSSRK